MASVISLFEGHADFGFAWSKKRKGVLIYLVTKIIKNRKTMLCELDRAETQVEGD